MNRANKSLEIVRESFPSLQTPIIDVGCGQGETVQLFINAGYNNITGIDIDTALAPPHLQSHLIKSDAGNMAVKSESFDVALLLDVIEHVPSPEKILAETHRILKPQGLLMFSVPYAGLAQMFDPANIQSLLTFKKPNHHHFSLKEIDLLFEDLFHIEKLERRGLGISQIARLASYPIRKILKKDNLPTLSKIGEFDYSIMSGPIAYHILISARKI